MRRSTRPILLILLAILISGFIVYSPAVRAPFYLDDNSRIIDNPVIRSFSSIKWIWEYDPSRFIPHVTFAFNYLLDGINPAGYHVGNILIHILNTIIVLFLVRLLLSRGSFIGTLDRKYLNYLLFGVTLVFLLHPIQTSAVTYVVQRSTLLAATAYFSTILFYLLFKLKRSMGFYSASLICAAAGVFCKPLVITLPFVIILCELFCFDKSEENHKRRFLYVLPYFVIILLAFASYIVVSFKSFSFAHLTTISRETVVISRTSYLLTEFNVVVTYLRLLFFPLNQNLDYDYPIASSLFTSPTIFSFLVLVLLVGWGWSQRKRQPLISFGVFWFFLTLSSESSIFPISDVIFEHRLYIPMFGFALFLPVAIVLLFKNKHIASGVLAIVILIFFCIVVSPK